MHKDPHLLLKRRNQFIFFRTIVAEEYYWHKRSLVPSFSLKVYTMRQHTCLRHLLPIAIVALATTGSATRAQRIAVYDFSTQQPKDRIRQPKPSPPGSGRCGGILGNPPVRVSLLSLDKIEYAIGDDVVFTIKIANTGPAPERVPVAYNLADMEPPDGSQDYNYQPMEIWLLISKPNDSREIPFLSTLALTLYGSNDRPDTQVELKTGEWIEVRGRARLENTSASGKRFNADTYVYSTIRDVTEEIPDMKANVFSWRGDDFRFVGHTQYEYYSCRGYEMSGGLPPSQPVDLLPPKPSK
jgi:hypothetical protein